MDYNTEYYWRVDVNDGDSVATGKTWHFLTTQDPSIVLNENFDDNGFPSGGWTFENSDENLWIKYYGISAYGEGVNSARAKFFLSLISDSVSSMITHTFYPLNEGNTLVFDYAYAATSMYFIDSLEILYSTDSGISWESLVLLHGGPNGELVTAPHSTSEFIPDPDEWETMKLTLPEGVTKIKFKAMSADGNDLFLDNIRIIDQNLGAPDIVDINISDPTEFPLKQNYPNPFNPSSKVTYSLSSAGKVTLRVYNVLGKEISTLVNDDKNASVYTVYWNGTDSEGNNLPSGVYIYTVHSQNQSISKKMILLK